MNKLFTKIGTAMVGIAMAVGVGVAVGRDGFKEVKAATASFAPADFSATAGAQSVTKDNIVTCDISRGAYNAKNTDFRVYASETMTVSVVQGYKITAISFAGRTSGNNSVSNFSADCGSYTAPNWTASTTITEVVFSCSTQTQITGMTVTYEANASPVVTITNPPSSLEIGAKGTFAATSTNATNPSYTWSSNAPTVLEVNEDGSYEALARGSATVTVNMTCTEGSASKTATIAVNAGEISIATAKSIIDELENSGDTTPYTVTISGYVTNLDADDQASQSKSPRALNVSFGKVGSEGDTLLIYGIYDSNPVRNYIVLNAEVKYTGKLQKYVKNEVTTYEMVSPVLDEYTDDAIEYAKASYAYLQSACNIGPSAVTNEQWTKLAEDWDDVDEYSQAKLRAATSSYEYNEDIAKWMDRYGRIIAYGRTDFMELPANSGAFVTPTQNNIGATSIIVIIAAVLTTLTVAGIFLLKKKEEK